MMTDRFALRDEKGNLIAEKTMVEHLKVILDEMNSEPGHSFDIRSEVTGYEFHITDSTKPEEWREFADKCLMALD